MKVIYSILALCALVVLVPVAALALVYFCFSRFLEFVENITGKKPKTEPKASRENSVLNSPIFKNLKIIG